MYPKISLRSDHCRGIDAVLSQGKIGEVYNIGGRSECENIHLVRMLCTIAVTRSTV
jgi:dTDP-glucose 4,6-dehydratase